MSKFTKMGIFKSYWMELDLKISSTNSWGFTIFKYELFVTFLKQIQGGPMELDVSYRYK